MNDTATIATCSCCRARFIGVPGLCPECEKDSEFYKLSRKKGDPRDFIPYPALFQQWKARRAECREWRKTAEQAANDRAARVQAEQERAQALAVLHAAGIDPTPALALAAELDKARAELARTQAERDRLQHEVNDYRAGRPDPLEVIRQQWEQGQARLMQAVAGKAAFPPEQWRRLVQLAHPDRHGDSPAAVEATRWLLENRP